MRLVYVISNIDRWITFEWMVKGLKGSFDLSVILLNPSDSYFEDFLRNQGVYCVRVPYRSKRDFFSASIKVRRHLQKTRPDVVHCHFLDASLVGLVSAWLVGVPHRIHTRHHSVFHHRYSKKGVFLDQIINKLSTKIVAISQVVWDILEQKEAVHPGKMRLIHHGFELDLLDACYKENSKAFREKHNIKEGQQIVAVVSRYISWKGVEFIIQAFDHFLRQDPNHNFVLCLFNAKGPGKRDIEDKLRHLPKESFRQITFEKDLYKLLSDFWAIVHVPIDSEAEAFGQIYIEALASKTPLIATRSGIANQLLVDRENALVVPYRDHLAIAAALRELSTNEFLRENLKKNSRNRLHMYSNEHFCENLRALYEA